MPVLAGYRSPATQITGFRSNRGPAPSETVAYVSSSDPGSGNGNGHAKNGKKHKNR